MKKLIILTVLLNLILGIVFADENESKDNQASFLLVSTLLMNHGLNKNFDIIKKESINLSDSQKVILYNMNEDKLGLPLALNILVGLGLGSAVQGDIAGSVVGLLGDLTGCIFLLGYYVKIMQITSDYSSDLSKANTFEDIEKAEKKQSKKINDALSIITTSAVILSVTRVFQIIKPIIYSSSYNNKLKQALYSNYFSFDVLPSFDFDGNAKLTLAMSYKF